MPRRKPDSFAEQIGQRVAQLRRDRKLTLEKLSYGGDIAKGSLSELERGLVRPSLPMLKKIADALDVEVLDLFTFPGEGARHDLVDATRDMPAAVIRRLLADATEGSKRRRP